jgi:hypothetical protein
MKKLLALLCLASLMVAPACCWHCKKDGACERCSKKHVKTEKKDRGAKKEKTTKMHHHHQAKEMK